MLGFAFINAETVVLFFFAMAERVSPLLIVDEGKVLAAAAFGPVFGRVTGRMEVFGAAGFPVAVGAAGLTTAGVTFGRMGDGAAGFEPE